MGMEYLDGQRMGNMKEIGEMTKLMAKANFNIADHV